VNTASTTPQTIDAYIASRPAEHHKGLQQLRALAHQCVPDAEECINYGMPGLRSNGRVIVWFASFSQHLALFPRAKAIEVFAEDLQKHSSFISTSKGTIRFALTAPLPAAMIRRVIRFCVKEQGAIAAAKKQSVKKKVTAKSGTRKVAAKSGTKKVAAKSGTKKVRAQTRAAVKSSKSKARAAKQRLVSKSER
jgi:uncharacterized protein YdhG (YjbR/CyaY superfamily)